MRHIASSNAMATSSRTNTRLQILNWWFTMANEPKSIECAVCDVELCLLSHWSTDKCAPSLMFAWNVNWARYSRRNSVYSIINYGYCLRDEMHLWPHRVVSLQLARATRVCARVCLPSVEMIKRKNNTFYLKISRRSHTRWVYLYHSPLPFHLFSKPGNTWRNQSIWENVNTNRCANMPMCTVSISSSSAWCRSRCSR